MLNYILQFTNTAKSMLADTEAFSGPTFESSIIQHLKGPRKEHSSIAVKRSAKQGKARKAC